jgi:allantoin racemase
LKEDPARVADRVAEVGSELIRRREADVLVLGCMSLAFLGVAERTARELAIPIVNPARCALKMAESLASQGLLQSRRTYAKPRKEILSVEEAR